MNIVKVTEEGALEPCSSESLRDHPGSLQCSGNLNSHERATGRNHSQTPRVAIRRRRTREAFHIKDKICNLIFQKEIKEFKKTIVDI